MAKNEDIPVTGNTPTEHREALEVAAQPETPAPDTTSTVEAAHANGILVTARDGVKLDSSNKVDMAPKRVSLVDSRSETEEDLGNGVEANSGCGWHFCFSGNCVRHSRTAKWLLFWMCCAVFTLSMMVNGFMNVNVTTIEKRFQLKSKSSGLIISSWDLGSVSLVAPLSYIGSRPGTSKSRMLGTCVIIAGLGCYMALLPHFFMPPYDTPRTSLSATEDSYLCRPKPLPPRELEIPEQDAATLPGTNAMSNFLYVFIFASFITGLFSSPVFPVGASFIDESVSPEQSAFYLGILLTAATVGPPVAFGLGGQLLKVYIDAPAGAPANSGLTPASDRWLGAWWIGYGITGTLSLLIGINILMIPPIIPRKELAQTELSQGSVKYASRHMNPVRQRHSVVVLQSQPSPHQYLQEFLRASRTLICNVPFVLLSLAKAGEMFIFAGIVPFLPKFMEIQFGISAGLAAMSMAIFGLLGGAAGTFVGGWLITYFKMSCKAVLRFCFFVSLSCVLSGIVFLIRCPNKSFAGVTSAYLSNTILLSPNITSSCNTACRCADVPFSPVCGANNVIYFSPCHAGCTHSSQHNDQEVFSNCSCVDALRKPSAATKTGGLLQLLPDQAVDNGCVSDCWFFEIFVSAHLIFVFLTVLTAMPIINATMRCVAFDLRAYAIGLQGLPLCLLGTVPGPIVFGAVVDMACFLWSEPFTGTGACVVYDNVAFGSYMFILALTVKIIVVACLFVAWRWYDEKFAQKSTDETTEGSRRKSTSSLSPLKSEQKHQEGLAQSNSSSECRCGHANRTSTQS